MSYSINGDTTNQGGQNPMSFLMCPISREVIGGENILSCFGTKLETKGIPAVSGVPFSSEKAAIGGVMEVWNEVGSFRAMNSQ
jgi:hypothetical protein